jgi:flagellar assembly protein FliH
MSVVTPLPLADLPRSGWADATELAQTVLGEVAEKARAEAEAQGYAVGWARGRRAASEAAAAEAETVATSAAQAEARREAEHRAAVAALESAAAQVRDALADLREQLASQGTDLALAITETVLARELSVLTDADVVRRVMATLPPPAAKVRLHPHVAGSVDAKELADAGLVVTADPALDHADAVVEADGSVTDLRIATAIERLRDVLA